MKKIVLGNDFNLIIPVSRKVHTSTGDVIQDFNLLPACTDLQVNLVNFNETISLPCNVDVEHTSRLIANVDSSKLNIGNYALEVKGKIYGNAWRSNEYEQIAFVNNNASADEIFDGEIIEGESSVEVDHVFILLPPSVELSDLIDKANDALKNNKETNDTINANESARQEAEAQRVTAESERTNAEQSRSSAEETRVSAEGDRANAESDRVRAEDARTQIEIERQANELTRKDNESKRLAAEKERAKTEEARVTAENSRADAEAQRVDAEERRVIDESKRAVAENGRASAEAERVKAENKRQSDISAAIGNMSERTETAISELNTHRTEFDEAESQRVSAENERVEAETIRKHTEAGRVSAEGARAEAEQARVDAETKRKSDFDKSIQAAETATTGAEKVNAELEGNVLKVTNRNGEVKSLDFEQWDLEEKVNISISTSVEGVSVNGIVVNVFLNGATTSTKYTSDAEGKISFAIPRGTIYKVSFQELKNCDPLPSLTYTAALRVRDINVEYKALSGETASVVVTIDKAENGEVTPLQGVPVTCEIANGDTTTTETNKNGKVTFGIPWGKTYKITAGKAEGYYAFKGIYEKNNVADVAEHNLYYHFFPVTSGVFILDTAGAQYTLDEWQQSGKTEEDAALVKITTQNLAGHNSSVGFSPSAMQAGYPSKQWCTQNVLFNNIPTNGNNTNDALYYDGYKSSKLIREEAQERGLTIPAFSYAYGCTVEMAGETLHGYIASVGQMAEMNINRTVVDNVIKALYGDTAKLFSSLFADTKWTSTQSSATGAWAFSSAALSGTNFTLKSLSNVVLPVFAC